MPTGPTRSALWLTAGLLLGLPAVAGCTSQVSETEAGSDSPAALVRVPGTDRSVVALTRGGAMRLQVATDLVREVPAAVPGQPPLTAIPLSAVIYDQNGATWTYTQTLPLKYVRAPITLARVDGQRALLYDGPAAGAAVVTVGAAELLGLEEGVGGD